MSVAGHELAHALVAHRYGLAVCDITLLPIGGLTRIEQGPLPPRREAAIALAGPVLNGLLALGLFPFVASMVMLRDLTTVEKIAGLLSETSMTSLLVFTMISNLLLAVLNLLPAFPMDGGRVLRAWLSTVSERSRATRVSVAAGYVVALASLTLGVWFRDPTLPVAGLFLAVAAFLEQRTLDVEEAMQRLPVGQFAVWDSGGVLPTEPLARALQGARAMSRSSREEWSLVCSGARRSCAMHISRISCE